MSTWRVVRRDNHSADFVPQREGLSYEEALKQARDMFNREIDRCSASTVTRTSTSWMADYKNGGWVFYTVSPEGLV